MSKQSIYNIGLDQGPANYESLTPISFLRRAAQVYPRKLAVIHGDIRRNWLETEQRCLKLASALNKLGLSKGDTVSVIAPNLPELFEAHFGVPMCGAVLNAINTRLDPEAIAFILQHAETKVLLVDKEFSSVAKKALKMIANQPVVVAIDDPLYKEGELLGSQTYEELLTTGDDNFVPHTIVDEWQAISLNYTSGTTGNPKGVVYHHRGAYLNALSNVLSWNMGQQPVYLWTLPMFHCNGWCFPWSLASTGGASVFLRHVRSDAIFEKIKEHRVGYFCGAPIVLNMLNNAPAHEKSGINHQVKVMTAGAAPPATVIQGMEELGMSVTHVYGLTETYGPCVVCNWDDDWNDLGSVEVARLKARQGVKAPLQEGLIVAKIPSMEPVPMDGKTIGEILLRGNLVMKGYLKNPSTTEESFGGGWFHTGDLAVWHSDGYVEIKDRSKDIIISGGENISSIEVEDVLYRHPLIDEAAVVAMPNAKWGEVPCAFISLKEGETLTEDEVVHFCRDQFAHFKAPKHVVFGPLPKTSTGKVQKFVLRNHARDLEAANA